MAQAAVDQKLPAILCLHGHGTNGAIFRHQARNITRALQSRFRFVFAESPIETPQPGIGVLPYFADAKPYRRWHHDAHAVGSFDVTAEDIARERQLVRDTLAAHVERHQPVGVMAFSQGTRVAAALCLDPELGGGIRFAILICGFAGVLPLDGSDSGLESRVLDLPSVQAQGVSDPWAAKAAKLAEKSCFDPALARTIKFRGGHDVPVAMGDVVKITNEIFAVYESLSAS
ncbi:serine hydrolase FSH [Hypoxylon rubiginosum]|uniref:Serine hydrolase FSH n=1 Tax=Hypoxylon rubiginosum TaxID=110542 RepID=A0ACB9Z1C2_9PEZI|nr:serine hydrolase FSH [Hypoxylon rubiginosum]